MLSYWEQTSFIHYDFIIVGSGIAGLSTACCIKERSPKSSVLVLERGIFPTGASTKNAGFACFGNVGEITADLELIDSDRLLQLSVNRWEGLQLLRKRLSDKAIDFQPNGGYELILYSDTYDYKSGIEKVNQLFNSAFKKEVYVEDQKSIDRFGFNKNLVKTMIYNSLEGQIDTGKMMSSLLLYAQQLGIKVISGAEVLEINENEKQVEVIVKSEIYGKNESIKFEAEKVAICTNAFSKRFFPNADLEPGRGQVICTSEIPDLKIKGTFNFTEGYYYFRNINNRILFGGARNVDYDNETTDQFALTEKIQQNLEYYLKEMILPDVDYTIDYRWSGIMAFGKEITPEVLKASDRIVAGFRFNGMGVALGSKVAEQLTDLLLL
ncbi:NAD(P)/FAD-dependent oxidoreductase [Solitalea canadensis]|uniref:Glycine/D-amino acid oxidase, deaminating n=1 Tax=Solitalea canadensis (strain ATCC 29591 / DSM 3403 / JCM 21819 / LMG 8368 / NBRC 15130 / NCIMB 12057 / USAM 9D) TaxID=929556 RepID=H8KY18_SOLCM|nr:FAD-dependent oxidoreductase [Solitalea canadensis]AFD05756.1 glycine/D-amino acid oxidase, deaminating [Solitalea canadensis DSM 3403]